MTVKFLFKICILFIFPLCVFSQSKNKEIVFNYDATKDWDNKFYSHYGKIYINQNNGESTVFKRNVGFWSDKESTDWIAHRTGNNIVKKLGGQTWTCFNVTLEGADKSITAVVGYKDDAVFVKYTAEKAYSVIYLKNTTNNINCDCDSDIKTGILYCEWCNGQIINQSYHIGYDEGRCKVITGSDYYYPKNYHQKCATEKCEKN